MGKNTHTIQDVEGLMYELVEKIKNAETKTEKQALIKKLKSLEKHYNDCNDKHINGKKYPERLPGYKSDEPMNKEEIFKLIEKGFPENKWRGKTVTLSDPEFNENLCGVYTEQSLNEIRGTL